MKKLDKLVLDAFIGPFVITFLVVVFILLNINMLKYFDDIIGKGLDWWVLGRLFFYFAIFTIPTAMPLAVLLSSLIAFGNLGEHFELTAIKSAGISLLRVLQPIFFFILLLTAAAFHANNNMVPRAALEAYSLLYDIKQKKPALELREGEFYRGIDNMSIKVNKKFPKDEQALKGVLVYDHRKNNGNKEVIVADSGRMYTVLGDRYLKFELYNGFNYTEGASTQRGVGARANNEKETLTRSQFQKAQFVFDLSSFQLQTTDKKWFQGNRIMRNLGELQSDMDSLHREVLNLQLNHFLGRPDYFNFFTRGDSLIMPPEVYAHKVYRDSIANLPYVMKYKSGGAASVDSAALKLANNNKTVVQGTPASGAADSAAAAKPVAPALNKRKRSQSSSKPWKQKPLFAIDAKKQAKVDSVYNLTLTREMIQGAANKARTIKSQLTNAKDGIDNFRSELVIFEIQWHKILASSFACIAMFLIGAPLGAIIKKGGLGVPFLVSILFFIVYYVIGMQGEKLAKQNTISVIAGVWLADVVLFVIGLFFLKQARKDARLFEADFYSVMLDKVKRWFARKSKSVAASAV
ncbi:LptF/LptG family permease [Chryseolinea sp. T2]|uniref:LptF/LptG family permease n=1 Tax=Chryseolinea sp. T2 TaxID=3129255 RepID=UPI0030780C24